MSPWELLLPFGPQAGQEVGAFNLWSFVLYLLRWIHIVAGIIWIGHLYFFNFVQGPFEKALDADAKKKVVPELRPRALWWFRWGAMFTFLAGIAYILIEEFFTKQVMVGTTFTTTKFSTWFEESSNVWITMGGLFGTVMWFNVWFIIWPNQRVIINGIKTGNKAPDHDARIRVAFLASRANTYLSVPMLFGMAGRSHFAAGGPGITWLWALGATVVGLGVAHLLIQCSGKVSTDV